MNETRMIASSAMMAALCVVIMLLGTVIDLGTYAAALLAGVAAIPYGQKYGRKHQLMVFAVSAALGFMLVLVPEFMESTIFIIFILTANVTFFTYDYMLPGLDTPFARIKNII